MVDAVGVREQRGAVSRWSGRRAFGDAAQRMREPGLHAMLLAGRTLVRVVWAVVALLDAVLLLDFLFRLIGARDDGFAHVVFWFGATLASPFDGIFANVGPMAGYAFRWSDIVVVLLVTLAGFLVTRMIPLAQIRRRMTTRRPQAL